jgi:hypothetical protein
VIISALNQEVDGIIVSATRDEVPGKKEIERSHIIWAQRYG